MAEYQPSIHAPLLGPAALAAGLAQLNQPQPYITIRLVTDGDLVSRAIRSGETGFWASHAEALTSDGFLLGAHYQGGVAKREPDYDKGQWELELYVKVPCTQAQADAFYAFLNGQLGKPYDMSAILGIVRGELTGMASIGDSISQNSWICSALMMGGLINTGIIKCAPSSVRFTTPRDLAQVFAGLGLVLSAPSKPAYPKPGLALAGFDPFN